MTTAHDLTRTPNKIRDLAERVADDFGAFAYDGFGVMLDVQQLDAVAAIGMPGPRTVEDEAKTTHLSGGQRSGKTVLGALLHNRACLYKQGVDNSDPRFWRNYLYKTLAGAPTGELSLKLWQVMDELSKGANDSQFDRTARRSRGGAFLHLMQAGKAGDYPVVRFENGARTDFRSTEGWAFRLEGDQWWFFTWDEWASQPDREIEFVHTDVLMGRARDHDAKIVLMAWPKAATERHLIAAIRKIESGADTDSQVVYLSAADAYFTNPKALSVERRRKSEAQWLRTVLGRPGGGASIEFPPDVVTNMVKPDLPTSALPREGFHYLSAWDIGLAHDATVGMTFEIPSVGVSTTTRARIVNATELRSGESITLDNITFAIAREQVLYRSQSAVDASGLGGIAAVRQLRDLKPNPVSFVARSNDRIWGNMRLAAITNALDMLTWGRDEDKPEEPWGLIEAPKITKLLDQLANFDREAKNVSDDWVWSFLIGLWYIRRWWVVGRPVHDPVPFDPRPQRREAISLIGRRRRGR